MSEAQNLLFVIRQAPYGTRSGRDALEAVLAASAYDQPVSLLFCQEGVWQLVDQQDPAAIGQKSLSKLLAVLELYDVTDVYVCQASLNQRGLTSAQCAIAVEPISQPKQHELLNAAKHVLSF